MIDLRVQCTCICRVPISGDSAQPTVNDAVRYVHASTARVLLQAHTSCGDTDLISKHLHQ